MSNNLYRDIIGDGLWRNNVVFTQMLALCPLMAVTTTATNGLGMGFATTGVLLLSNITISALRAYITPEVRIPVYVLLIASLVTMADMAVSYTHLDVYKRQGGAWAKPARCCWRSAAAGCCGNG